MNGQQAYEKVRDVIDSLGLELLDQDWLHFLASLSSDIESRYETALDEAEAEVENEDSNED